MTITNKQVESFSEDKEIMKKELNRKSGVGKCNKKSLLQGIDSRFETAKDIIN